MVEEARLTPREKEIVALLQEGLTNKAIADRLGTTLSTVRTQVSTILLKLGVENRTAAALKMMPPREEAVK